MGPLSLLNPWVIIGLTVLFAGSNYLSYDFGGDVEQGRQAAVNAKALKRAHVSRDLAIESGRVMTDALMNLNKKTEGKYNAAIAEVEDMYRVNGRFIALAGGLYDKNGRPTGLTPTASGPGSAPAVGPGSPAAGCKLSTELSDFLQSRFRDADADAVYGATCHTYAIGLRSIIENRCQPIAGAP